MDIEQNNMIYNHLQEILTENNKLKIKSKQLQEQCNDLYSSGSAT
jgi:regulator of replication initiation timing